MMILSGTGCPQWGIPLPARGEAFCKPGVVAATAQQHEHRLCASFQI